MEVFSNRLLSITEEMGNTLVRSSFSTNIKERKDCSVALLLRHQFSFGSDRRLADDRALFGQSDHSAPHAQSESCRKSHCACSPGKHQQNKHRFGGCRKIRGDSGGQPAGGERRDDFEKYLREGEMSEL